MEREVERRIGGSSSNEGYRPRTHWKHIRIPQEELESVAGGMDVWNDLLHLHNPTPDKRKKMDGWTDDFTPWIC